MKTTLVIPDQVFRDLKRQSAESGRTLSDLVTELLRIGLREQQKPKRKRLPPLPSFKMGLPKVNIADRDELYHAMEEES